MDLDTFAPFIGKRVAVTTFSRPTAVIGVLLEVTPDYLVFADPADVVCLPSVHGVHILETNHVSHP